MSKKKKILIFTGAVLVILAFVVINLKKARGDVIEVCFNLEKMFEK